MELKNFKHTFIKMSNITHSCIYLSIFYTNKCKKILENEVEIKLKELINEYQDIYSFKLIDLTINKNSVQMFFTINPNIAPAKFISNLKKETASRLILIFPNLKTKMKGIWNREAFIATSGDIEMKDIIQFIDSQSVKKSREKT